LTYLTSFSSTTAYLSYSILAETFFTSLFSLTDLTYSFLASFYSLMSTYYSLASTSIYLPSLSSLIKAYSFLSLIATSSLFFLC